MGYERFQTLASPLEVFSVMISQSAPTPFLFTFSETTRATRGCGRLWIHASPLKGVSVMISESTATLFSLTISESIGTMVADKSTRHLWKLFRWLFLSQQGLWAVLKPRTTFQRFFGDDFQSAPTPFSLTFSELKGVVSASKSSRRLCKVSWWWFSSGHQIYFGWLFQSQTGVVGADESTRHL